MADEQNTVPINEGSPYAKAEQAAASVPVSPVAPDAPTASEPTITLDAEAPSAFPVQEVADAVESYVAEQGISGFDKTQQVTYYGSQPMDSAMAGSPTESVGAAPVASHAQETTPMPNPYPAPQPTTPIPPSPTPTYGAVVMPPPAPTFAGAGAGQQASQQPAGSYANAVPTPVYSPEQVYGEVNQLSGGMKFGWLVIGLLMGIPGMLLAWLTNTDKHPQVKKDAILWSVIGFAINVVLVIIASVAMIGIVAAAVGTGSYYGYPF